VRLRKGSFRDPQGQEFAWDKGEGGGPCALLAGHATWPPDACDDDDFQNAISSAQIVAAQRKKQMQEC
jgi:hypothetical protein